MGGGWGHGVGMERHPALANSPLEASWKEAMGPNTPPHHSLTHSPTSIHKQRQQGSSQHTPLPLSLIPRAFTRQQPPHYHHSPHSLPPSLIPLTPPRASGSRRSRACARGTSCGRSSAPPGPRGPAGPPRSTDSVGVWWGRGEWWCVSLENVILIHQSTNQPLKQKTNQPISHNHIHDHHHKTILKNALPSWPRRCRPWRRSPGARPPWGSSAPCCASGPCPRPPSR